MIFCARRELQARLKIEQLSCSARNYEIHSRKRARCLISRIFLIFSFFFIEVLLCQIGLLWCVFLPSQKKVQEPYLYLVNKKIQVRAPITAFRFHILSFFIWKPFYPSVRLGALGVQRRQYNSTSDQSASCSQNSKTNQPAFLELWKSFPKRCFLGGQSLWSYEARLPCRRKVRLCGYLWKESSCMQVLLSERMILEIDPFLVFQVSRAMLSLAKQRRWMGFCKTTATV